MFQRAFVVLRRVEDAPSLSSYLKKLNIKDAVITILDVSGIPVDAHIVSLTTSQILEEASKFFKDIHYSFMTLKYLGDKLPAEYIMDAARETACDIIIIPTTLSGKPITSNLASTLALLSNLPVLVIPVEVSRPI